MIPIVSVALVLQMHNLAGAPSSLVGRAESEVARMYDDAGVHVEWDRPEPAASRDAVRVILLPYENGDLRRAPDTVMGAAVRSPGGTRIAYVYYRRVLAEAERYSVSTPFVLAGAIAHEVGHLLMPGGGHSRDGIMRACWNRDDFVRADQSALRFSEGQIAVMRRTLGEASQPSVEDERRDRARGELDEHDRRQRSEGPVAPDRVLRNRDDDAGDGRREQDDDAGVEQYARAEAVAGRERGEDAQHHASAADRDARAKDGADGALEVHRPPRANIIAERTKSTIAIITFSHFADAAAPNLMPPHDPICTPRTAAAASAGCTWPRP